MILMLIEILTYPAGFINQRKTVVIPVLLNSIYASLSQYTQHSYKRYRFANYVESEILFWVTAILLKNISSSPLIQHPNAQIATKL